MTRLQTINIVFPNSNENEKDWINLFGGLFLELANTENDEIRFALMPEGYLPSTVLRGDCITFPMITFDDVKNKRQLAIDLETIAAKAAASSSQAHNNDNFLPIDKLHALLKGRVVGVDHTGVNLPISIIPRLEWERVLNILASHSNVYHYPEEEWPFIIPADEAEFKEDITSFDRKRTPKFELVYDQYASKPALQFALETNIPRAEMEELFPAPSGFSIPGLEEIFRSVLIQSPWNELLTIRIDLYYLAPEEAELSDWETGEWLIREGGRVQAGVTK
ncbi:hypothetical protein NQ117_19750 [Paenibacillus sp. SC116]|uniref:hypothetical protein n=1 Tax=Paenibacillus sp. SC116 TaxID=2968986 RepID=UPI00215B7105|nr:hypothetical protein [Paenibacillus sp. SC116]MCR8845920.1 hypothetical protein [Paenibacillus sp. SC116]